MPDDVPSDPAIAAARQDQARAEARKAAADARTAEIAAETARMQAAVGALPESVRTGKVDVATDGGKAEATLLAAKAATAAAHKIAEAAAAKVEGLAVRLYAGADKPTVEHWAAFDLRRQLLLNGVAPEARRLDASAVALLEALAAPAALATPAVQARAAAVPLAALTLGFSALTKVAGLLQGEYQSGGIPLAPDDAMLATAVAGELLRLAKPPRSVILAGRGAGAGADAALLDLLRPVAELGAHAQARIAFLRGRAKALCDDPAAGPPQADAAAACEQAAAAWKAAADGCDALLCAVTAEDSAGRLPIVRIAAEKPLGEALDAGDLVLSVQMNAMVGSFDVEKSLTTALGREPFSVAAGTVASYALMRGRGGETLAAGVIPVHGGSFKIGDVPGEINGDYFHTRRY